MSTFSCTAWLSACCVALGGTVSGQTSASPGRPAATHAAEPLALAVIDVAPPAYSFAPANTSIRIDFDLPVSPSSITPRSLRVFGQASGPHSGGVTWSNANRTLTFQPAKQFLAGEVVVVSLSHDVLNHLGGPLREAGHAWRFNVAATPSTGTFTLVQTFATTTTPTWDFTILPPVDLDGDGDLDIVTVHGGLPSILSTFHNAGDGSGSFTQFGPTYTVGWNAGEGRTSDFDGDGRVDFCIVSATQAFIAFGDGAGGFSQVDPYQLQVASFDVGVMDLNGDGHDDVCPAGQQSFLRTFVNGGTGVFSKGPNYLHGMNTAEAIAEGDLNGDGITDLTLFDGISFVPKYVVMLGMVGGGLAANGVPVSIPGGCIVSVVNDLDGDGLADAVAAGGGTNKISVLHGTGLGGFDAITSFTAGTPLSVDVKDFDGDNDLDLAVADLVAGRVRMYRKLATPGYELAASLFAPTEVADAVMIDFDNDGDLDVAVADVGTGQILIFRND
jgi:hypothetical protein